MRVLISGVTGFVGGYLAAEIAASLPGVKLWGMGHAPSAVSSPPTVPNLRLLHGELTDPAFVRAVAEEAQPDWVYHLAGFASGAGTDRERIFEVNVTATGSILRALAAGGRPVRVLIASSGYVYGATQPGRPAVEDDPLAAHGAYAESKAAMEEVAQGIVAESAGALRVTIARAFNHTGPRQTPMFAVPAFASQVARIEQGNERPVVRVGNLDAIRDFLDVRDVVRAYRLLLEDEGDTAYRVFNVCSGIPVSMRSVLDRLIAQATVPVTVETDPSRLRPSDIPECVGDRSHLTAATGWEPEIDLDATLSDTLSWWRAQ